MILFYLYDKVAKLYTEPRPAPNIEIAKLSIGKFFNEHLDYKERISSFCFEVIGKFDPTKGFVLCAEQPQAVQEALDFYLKSIDQEVSESVE